MNKIALIIPYFTVYPPIWLNLNFYSCSKQSNIDFIYFTDCDEIINMASKYPNIICHKVSFEEYCDNVSKRLEVDFHPEHAYKLCDLKPFYGFIHQDILEQYDFWGYGDNDLIYGNLNVLTNENMLNTYDVITTMSERIAGHFAIFRNNEKYLLLPFKCSQWKEQLLYAEHVGFDESDWVRLVLPEKRILTAIYKSLFKPFMSYGKWVGIVNLLRRCLPHLYQRMVMSGLTIIRLEKSLHPMVENFLIFISYSSRKRNILKRISIGKMIIGILIKIATSIILII